MFGDHRKLEPLPPEKRARWRKEIDWLLAVTDHIVEFVPTEQVLKDGQSMEVRSNFLFAFLFRLHDIGSVLDNFNNHHLFIFLSISGYVYSAEERSPHEHPSIAQT